MHERKDKVAQSRASCVPAQPELKNWPDQLRFWSALGRLWRGWRLALTLSGCGKTTDNAYYQFANGRFPNVGTSAWLATLWGIISRAHLLMVLIPIALWRPGLLGFQIGKSARHWRMLLLMLLVNCDVIAFYLWLTRGTTPYSNDIWLVTEVVTVPLVEETFWRGLVYAGLRILLARLYLESSSQTLAIWLSGACCSETMFLPVCPSNLL